MNVSIIVPSYEPDEKLMQVVQGLHKEGFSDIILVNDGSSAANAPRFDECKAAYPDIVTVLVHEVNKGKGRAMKTAFAWCIENRPEIDGVVTVDGDNQHRPADVKACAEAMIQDSSKIWLGVRDFSLEQVPLRSRFGNTITRSIVKLACGAAITDTQTGLRAIPRAILPLMCEIQGERYEFETQMLLEMPDHKIGIGEVIIDTVYIDENQTSHFNTIKDSWRIYKLIFKHIGRKLGRFFKFSASSIISFLVDYGLFTLLNSVILSSMANGGREYIATYGARVISAVVNFCLNRKVVFNHKGSTGKAAGRYALLAIVQAGISAGLVTLLHKLTGSSNLAETAIKIPVDLLLFVLSYQIQKKWVFREEDK